MQLEQEILEMHDCLSLMAYAGYKADQAFAEGKKMWATVHVILTLPLMILLTCLILFIASISVFLVGIFATISILIKKKVFKK